MDLGGTAPTSGRISATNICRSRYIVKENAQERCNRKGKNYQISEQSLHSTKERFIRGQMGNGLIKVKRIYKVPQVQNANYERGEALITKRFLVGLVRPQRRILACPSSTSQKTIPRLQVQGPELAVQGYALRPKYSTTNIYKGNGSYCQSNGNRRNMVFTVFGRPPHIGTYKRRVPTSSGQSSENIRRVWLDHKSRKISQTTSTNFRMVRDPCRSQRSYCKCHTSTHGRSTGTAKISNKVKVYFKKKNYEDARVSQLDWPKQQNHSLDGITNKNFDKSIQKTKIRYTITPNKRHETQPNQMVEYTKNSTSTRKPNTVSDNPNRCIINRLGNENQQQNIPRNFRSFNGKLVNKCSRTSDHMVCITNGQREEPSDTSPMRQLNSSCSSQTKFVHNFSFSNDLRTNMEESNYDGLDTDSSTHPRQIQYHCRPVEQESYTVNRMVTTSERFQNDSENEPKTSGRPICYSLESQAKDLHIPMSRSTSGGHRCHGSAMGQMETSVPLSPVIADFEGFSQIDGNQVQKCYSNNPGNANQTLVHGIETTLNTINSDESSPTTSSSEQDGKSNQPDQTSRLEVIKAGYSKQHPLVPPEGIALMSKPVGGTSINEYQRKWRAFISFLKREKISFEQVTIDSVLHFLYFLFYTRKLSLSTVALYRTALSVPMLIYFQIDLNVKAVTDLLRGMSHERPKKPPSTPTWSLNKVLTFLENLNNNMNQTMLLKKTAFLLLLATGWRISELHACVRDKEFCSFTSNGILRIRPHPSFLGKNEKPQNRWNHTEIKVLKLRNGSISKICPVTTLRSYLQRTSKYKKGKLFLPPEKHQKKMSIYSLSKHICEVILMADPGVRARVHDVRKYAASLSFTNTMATEDLMQAMNWSSPVTFFKFYFCQTEPLDRPVTLPITESLN